MRRVCVQGGATGAGGAEARCRVELLPAEGAVRVLDGAVAVLVSLTSAVMREPNGESSPRCRRLSTQFHLPYSLLAFTIMCSPDSGPKTKLNRDDP